MTSVLQTLPMYLEFIQHHLLMGASHIFLAAPFMWGGKVMTLLQRTLRTYIEDGSVSISSTAGDALDYSYTVEGVDLGRDNVKILQVIYKREE